MRLLLDTNVLIDYFSGRKPYHDDAFRLRIMHEFGDVELWSSVQSFTDIAYILRGTASSEQLQDAFLESLNFLHVCSLDQDDLLCAATEKWADVEDCLIEQCARKVKANYLLSRDASGFSKSQTKVLTPAAFFDLMKSEYDVDYALVENFSDD